MKRPIRLLILCLYTAPLFLSATSIEVGATYEEVISTLGEPDGDLNAGSRRILTYGNAKIKIQNGSVTSVSPELEKLLAERDAEHESVEAKRKKGLVNYKGNWMRANERDAIIARERQVQQRQAKAARQNNNATWTTNFVQAKALAEAQQKKLLISFTGSDWCGPCIRLDREVFSQQDFLGYAKNNYVLLKIDFPKKVKLPKDLETQNQMLADKYGVRRLPTILVLNSDGTFYKRGGYVSGGPRAFIHSIQ